MSGDTSYDQLCLYFQLKEGEKADLEVVAKAALEWVAALRSAAQALDPNADIKVEIVDAKEGSLSITTILDWLETRVAEFQEGKGKYPRLRKLALAFAIFIPITGYPTYKEYFGPDQEINLSQEDREILKSFIEKINEHPEIEEKRQSFFRAIEQDPSISGVGVTENSNNPPRSIIPSSEFPARSGLWKMMLPEEEAKTRTVYPVVDVTLTGSALVTTPRSWKFQPLGLPEFSAKMEDKRFLKALENNDIKENLRIGIPMKLRLRVTEKKIDGTWKAVKRSVTEVISPRVN